jgi:hypothetical protein
MSRLDWVATGFGSRLVKLPADALSLIGIGLATGVFILGVAIYRRFDDYRYRRSREAREARHLGRGRVGSPGLVPGPAALHHRPSPGPAYRPASYEVRRAR